MNPFRILKNVYNYLNNNFFNRSSKLRSTLKPIKVTKSEYTAIFFKYKKIIDSFMPPRLCDKKIIKPQILINDDEISKVSVLGDWLGEVIYFNNKYYKGIKNVSIDKFLSLYKTGIYDGLCDNDFIPKFSISNYYSKKYPIILELEQVFGRKSLEWTLSETKRALLFCSILQSYCRKHGFCLMDPHSANVILLNNKFLYIDIGSINFSSVSPNDFSIIATLGCRVAYSFFPNSFFIQNIIGLIVISGANMAMN